MAACALRSDPAVNPSPLGTTGPYAICIKQQETPIVREVVRSEEATLSESFFPFRTNSYSACAPAHADNPPLCTTKHEEKRPTPQRMATIRLRSIERDITDVESDLESIEGSIAGQTGGRLSRQASRSPAFA